VATPLGADVPHSVLGAEHRRGLAAGTALERARAALDAFSRSGSADSASSAFDEPEPGESFSGHLVSRTPEVATPASVHLPGLSALLDVSRGVGATLLGHGASWAAGDGAGADTPWHSAARYSVADQLRGAAVRAPLTTESVARLRQVEELLGVAIIDDSVESALVGDDIAAVLVPGARVCFTGTAEDAQGRVVERDEMQRLASSAGLLPVPSVTKTRCEVLITAEVGSQSGKARKALEWGKPVFSAAEFFAWLAGVEHR
jgi:hypothetical protein